jgi:hypothetical protein
MAPSERTASPKRFASIVAWTGAAAFALSLLWFVYCYLVVFGRPAPPSPIFPAIATNFLLFSIFALHHSVLARSRPKAMVRQMFAPELERSLYTWVASLLFIGVCAWWQPVPGVLYELSGPFRILAFTLQALGVVLTVRASRALDVLDLAGVRAVQRSDDARECRGGDAQHDRLIRVRTSSVVFLVGALRVCHAIDDGHPRDVRHNQYGVLDARNPLRGTRTH